MTVADFELPKLKVLPNPWLLVHPTKGPQAAVMVDPAGRDDGPTRWLGAEVEVVLLEKREKSDPRRNRQFARMKFALSADLLSGEPIEVADTGYYRKHLEDGALVPCDEFTRTRGKARFTDLAAAKKAGVAELEAHHPGRWALLAKHFGLEGTPSAAAPAAPTTATADAAPEGKRGSK